MKIEQEILINKYGQNLVDIDPLLNFFRSFDMSYRKIFLNEMLFLVVQSKPEESDIEFAIKNSGLKSTFTPCVLLRKGVTNHNLQKLVDLPGDELEKVFILLMSLFKIAYERRFAVEKNNNSNKWWYWDLSEETNINKILRQL